MVIIGSIDRVSGKRVRPAARWPHRPLSTPAAVPCTPLTLAGGARAWACRPCRQFHPSGCPLGGVPLPRSPRLNPPPPPVRPPRIDSRRRRGASCACASTWRVAWLILICFIVELPYHGKHDTAKLVKMLY